jgi:hypothetical protein
VPNDSTVNFIIGKGGASINELQAQTGTHVTVQKAHEAAPGAAHRLVTVTGGSAEQREACGALIRAKIAEHRSRASGMAAQAAHAGMTQGIVHAAPPWQSLGLSGGVGCAGYQMHSAYAALASRGWSDAALTGDPYAWTWEGSPFEPHAAAVGLTLPKPASGWLPTHAPVQSPAAHPLTAANPLAGMVRLARHAAIPHGYDVPPAPRLPSVYAPRSAVHAARARRPA